LPYLKAMDPKSSKRLFLESIQEKGRAAETLPPYTFQYNPILLPNRFSNSQDNWGFYNGKNNGPYLTFFQYRNAPVSRKVDVTLSAAGLLTSMTYPTGGSVAYTYEHNLVDPPAYMNELLYPEKTITETVPKGISMIKNSQYYDAGNNVYSIPVTIGAGVTGAVEFEIDLPYCSEPSGESYCQYQVYLRGQGNDYYLYPMVPASRERSLGLSPGTYTLEVIPGPPHDPSEIENLFLVTLDWNEIVNSNEQSIPTPIGGAPLLAAGKRIGKIEYKNGDGTILRKKYSYLVPELNLPKTSGKLFGLPNFYYIKRTDMIGGVPIPTIDAYGSLPGTPLASLQGNSVGYSHVTEYYGDSLVNHGKTEYEFTTTQDGGTYYTFPYHVPVDNEWLRGKSTATRYYERNSGGTYSLKKAVTNSYLYAGSASGPELFMPPASSTAVYSKTRTNFYLPLLIFKEEAPGYKIYYLTGGTCDLYSTTETYYDRDLPKLTTQTNYLHDYARHYQLRGSENIMSDGTKETAITSYPNDYAAGTAFIDNMKTNNLHAYPIEEVLYKEAGGVRTILSGKITRYNDSNPALAAQVLSLENAGPVALSAFKFSSRLTGELPPDGTPSMFAPHSAYKPALTYDQYDASGNVLQHTRTDDMRVSYLWDYRNQYPIAEVKNAQQADIAYTSFEADGKGNWSFAGTPQPDNTSPGGEQAYNLGAGGITRSLLSTTKKYTLSFWAKSSQPPGVTGGAGASISAPEVLASANGWTRFGYEVTNTASVAISGSVLIDEVRLHPAVAQMSTYTYDPLTGMTSGTDPNGTTSYFKYDGLNRLQYVKDKDGNILKYYQYHYAQD
jgi:YD repeat-containing protein